MKILLAVHNFPPEFQGGVERVADLESRELAAMGHEVLVFAGSTREQDDLSVEEEVRGAVKVRRCVRGRGYPNPVDSHDGMVEGAFDQALGEFSPEIVHVHHWHHLSTGLVALAARRKIPAVVSLHDYWTTCALFFRMPSTGVFCELPERFEDCFSCVMKHSPTDAGELSAGFTIRFPAMDQELDLARALLVSSRHHADNLVRFSRRPALLEKKLQIIPLGLPDLPARPASEVSGHPLTIAHWGNLSRLKGVGDLFTALRGLNDGIRRRLLLFGRVVEPELESELGVADEDLEVVRHGRYDPETLAELTREVDFAVFPSRAAETHSLVVDEALALGLPVIVSDRGAMPERVIGRGLVVPAAEPEVLRKVLARWSTRAAIQKELNSADSPLPTMRDHVEGVLEVMQKVIDDAEPFPDYIPDYTRERLLFRQRRVAEIHHFVVSLERRRADIEGAIRGDSGALARLREFAPDLAGHLDRRPQIESDS